MDEGARVAGAAQALIGVRFRLHGRDPAHGLDCIGVIAASLRAAGWDGVVPTGYPLRGGDGVKIVERFDAVLARVDDAAPGDVLLFDVGMMQWHGAVRTVGGIVHADAALRRVVERPGPSDWPSIGVWRYGGGS